MDKKMTNAQVTACAKEIRRGQGLERFYSDPENVKRFEEWRKARETEK